MLVHARKINGIVVPYCTCACHIDSQCMHKMRHCDPLVWVNNFKIWNLYVIVKIHVNVLTITVSIFIKINLLTIYNNILYFITI